jgi:excisionase family DNA binding protein
VSLPTRKIIRCDAVKLKILHYPDVLFHQVTKSMSTSTGDGGILTIKEVAIYLKVTERTIYRLAAAKKIPAFKIGGSWRFSRPDIDSWIKQQSMENIDIPKNGNEDQG